MGNIWNKHKKECKHDVIESHQIRLGDLKEVLTHFLVNDVINVVASYVAEYQLIVAGGVDKRDFTLNSILIYDIIYNKWKIVHAELGDIINVHHHLTHFLQVRDLNHSMVYDFKTCCLTTSMLSTQSGRDYGDVHVQSDGKLICQSYYGRYLVAAKHLTFPFRFVMETWDVQYFSRSRNQYYTCKAVYDPDSTHTNNHDYLYICGGNSLTGARSCGKFTIQTQEWTRLPNMNFGRSFAFACLVDDQLFVCGGLRHYTEVEKYDPLLNKWIILAKMPQVRLYSVVLPCVI